MNCKYIVQILLFGSLGALLGHGGITPRSWEIYFIIAIVITIEIFGKWILED